ncbi:hypothetical protein [Myxacorys almedinensis]|uniref:Uncharacterized protein n=1 Tax=Myxacorys almedinensis A TaxID=2690445 RepID=A0A8J8CJT4_9CYAN|nr:hypothetical protein [Myxacorys almedinensis]NDJ17931.1 hypothetical protein [Myxacorys almedinensis A]
MQADLSRKFLSIDYTNEDEVLRFFPTVLLLSSNYVAENDLHFGYYQYPPFEMPESGSKLLSPMTNLLI